MNAPPRARVKQSLADLLPKFMTNRHVDVAQLRGHLAARDLVAVKAVGHRLKGAGAGYGFPEISLLGGDIERLAGRGERDGIEALVTALEEYLNTVEIEVI